MMDASKLVFIHGLEGSSQGVKATLLGELFPGMLIPDFRGSLDDRMSALNALLAEQAGWTIVGSSFGGLMSALFACQHPTRVRKQILLAPALIWPDFASTPPEPVSVPTIIFHGTRDEILPLEPVQRLAEQVFVDLDFRVVDDNHGLYKTVHALNWHELLS